MVKLIVEGDNDKNFVETLIKHFRITKNKYAFEITHGWEKIALMKNQLQQSKDTGGKNFVIFDADGDYHQRKTDIRNLLDNRPLVDDIFLFPDNVNPGNLETLLIQAMSAKHNIVNSCFDAYQGCIDNLKGSYKTPNSKTKVFAYLSILNKPYNEKKRNYVDEDVWNLNHKLIKDFVAYLVSILN